MKQFTPALQGLQLHTMQGGLLKCLAAGMDDYLSKPIDPPFMLAKIEKWLAAQRLPDTDEG